MRQYFITAFIIVIVAIGGFMLPPKLLQWQDEMRLGSVGEQAAEEVVLSARTDMTLIEKIQLMQKSSVTALAMEQGKNYSRDSIIDKAKTELQKLIELDILSLDSGEDIYSVDDILFLVDTEDGTKSMILWMVYVYTGEYVIGFSMDDETGKILSLNQAAGNTDASSTAGDSVSDRYSASGGYSGELESAAEKWGEYLGIPLAEVYDTPNPTANIDKDRDREIKALVKKGLSEEEATRKVYEAWGIDVLEKGHWLYGVYEDETGIAAYLFRKNMGATVFSAEF